MFPNLHQTWFILICMSYCVIVLLPLSYFVWKFTCQSLKSLLLAAFYLEMGHQERDMFFAIFTTCTRRDWWTMITSQTLTPWNNVLWNDLYLQCCISVNLAAVFWTVYAQYYMGFVFYQKMKFSFVRTVSFHVKCLMF